MARHLRGRGLFLAAITAIFAVTAALTVLTGPARASAERPVLQSAQAVPEAPCAGYTGYHYAALGDSGAGSNLGTGATELTWSNWSLDGHTSADGPFSDEAVWTINWPNYPNGNLDLYYSEEVGWLTGWLVNGGFTNAMVAYTTIQNGAAEIDDTSNVMPTGTDVWNSATSDGTHSWAYVNNQLEAVWNFGVPAPRFNREQTEVNYHDIWMGGGSGSNIAAEYQNTSKVWKDWGYITSYTGYYVPGEAIYSPAGYGYFADPYPPNGAVQGGYGGC